MTPPERQFHPAASIFPLLERYPLAELAEDIRRSGLREPIVLHPDGSILDGRNRYLACLKVGVEPRFRTWDDQGSQGSAVAFVVSCNLHRRHLTESQRAMVAARIATLEAHRPAAGSTAIAAVPQPEAAQMLNVSVDSVQRARQVQQHAAPELVQAVERGQVAVSTAAIVAAAVPPAEQAELIVRGEAEILARAKEIRAQHRAQRRQDDYYPTPPWLIRALLRYIEDADGRVGRMAGCEWLRWGYRTVLDPGAGRGALASEVEAAAAARGEQCSVTAVELNADFCAELREQHPAWTAEQGDFFVWSAQAVSAGRQWRLVITNPPFGHWQEWVDACFDLVENGGYLCVLAFANVLGAQSRAAWWREHRPIRVLFSPRRPQYRADSQNGDPRDTCWIVWQITRTGLNLLTSLDWLPTEGKEGETDA